jgi:hypothetical protein
VLDTNLLTRARVGPARHVASGENPGALVSRYSFDRDAAVHRQPCLFGKGDRRTYADTQHDEIGVERRAVAERHRPAVDASHALAEVEHNTLLFVHRLNEAPDLRPMTRSSGR